MSVGVALLPRSSSAFIDKQIIWCVKCANYVDHVQQCRDALRVVDVFVVQCHGATETIELHDADARVLGDGRLFVAFTAQSTQVPRRVLLLHPDDPQAALVHPNQWCPFLAYYWRCDGSNALPAELLLTYDERQHGCMMWATSDWWAGNYDGWRVRVRVGPRYERIVGSNDWRETGTWYISVGGNDDTACAIELPSHDAVRELLLLFPLVLTMRWLRDVGFVFG